MTPVNRNLVIPPSAQQPGTSSAPPAQGDANTRDVAPAQHPQGTGNTVMVVPPSRQGRDSFVNDAATGPVPPPGRPPVLTQHGGAVLDHPQIANIYVGDYWKTGQGAADKTRNDAYAQEFGTSKMMGIAAEYGAGATSFAGSTITSGASPTKFTETDVQNMVKQQLQLGTLPKGAQSIYTVVLPPNTVLDAGGGVTSLNGLGGFHGSVAGPDGQPIYYSVIAYSQGRNGIDFTGNPQDNVGITESHEWMEAMTDPDVNSTIPGRGLGWYDDVDNGEIGDLAISQLPLSQTWQRDENGFATQLEWSTRDGAYEIAPKNQPPPPPPPDGKEIKASAAPNAAIADNSTVTSKVHFDDDLDVQKLTANLDILHTFRGDLVVSLTSPSGKSVNISNREGGGADNIIGNFDLSSQFAGEKTQGDWTLTVKDQAGGDVGTLKDWGLDIIGKGGTPPPPAPDTATGSVTPKLPIPDLKTVTSPIVIDKDLDLSKVSVGLDISHTFRGDLVVQLQSPSGKTVDISNRSGGSADDLKGTFDLSQSFAGESSKGTWNLIVSDAAAQDTGTLNAWSLNLAGAPPAQ